MGMYILDKLSDYLHEILERRHKIDEKITILQESSIY